MKNKGRTFIQIYDSYKRVKNPVTRSVYREILVNRLYRDRNYNGG